MNYVGIDLHKKYSVLVAVNEHGKELARGRVEENRREGFAQFFARLEGESKVVLEACWNWGRIHDVLKELKQVEEVVLAHPLKTRLIAEAQIKGKHSGQSHTSILFSGRDGRMPDRGEWPRQLRIKYEGAIYHLLNPEDRPQDFCSNES